MDDKEKEKHDGTDVEEEEEDEEGNKRTVVLGPQVPLKEQLELDKDDESLRRWKEQLLGQVDTEQLGETAEPEVKVLNLTILSPGRPDLVLPIPFKADEKGYAFALKDGSAYSFRFSFIVSNNIVSGLKYTNTVWKTGVRGTFTPHIRLVRDY
uniref:Rho GDP-dissociation inhibitor 1 n=1 Tax=Arundo donax TaxID=35708 RepID=A0A0A9DKF2_ARUDO